MRPPAHLSKPAKKFWAAIQSEYKITDSAGLQILTNAAECKDRSEACRTEVEKTGLTIKNRMGGTIINPLVAAERDARAAMINSLKALNLDLEPLRDKPGRPGNKR